MLCLRVLGMLARPLPASPKSDEPQSDLGEVPDRAVGAGSANKIIFMEKQREIYYWWAALIGLFFPVLQSTIYYFRFRVLNPYAGPLDYALFFLAGALGGLILIAFLRSSRTKAARWIVVAAFLLATPFATLGMLGGSLLGLFGIVLLPGAIWAIFTGIGFWIGRFFSRSKMMRSEE